jgi:rod shape-determining protein MreC
MTLRRRLIDWGLAGLLLVIPALILRSSLKEPEETSKLDEAILRVSSPLQAAVSWIVDGIGGGWSRYIALVDVEEENRELRAENERLRKELAIATRRAIDIEALEEMLELESSLPADTVGARVIAASMSPYYKVTRIRVDRGAPVVSVGMPVITSAGLVGRIHKVYGGHADVMLTTDPSSSVAVMISRTGVRGILTGMGEDDAYACKLEWLERSEIPGGITPVEEGDKVVTSGLGADFPAGIEVGVVAKVVDKDYGMFQEVYVEPTVPFSDLRGVTVLLAPPPPPDPDADTRRRSESAFGVRPF